MGEEVAQRLAREVWVRDLAGSLGCVIESDALLTVSLSDEMLQKGRVKRWTCIPRKGGRNTLSCFLLHRPG